MAERAATCPAAGSESAKVRSAMVSTQIFVCTLKCLANGILRYVGKP